MSVDALNEWIVIYRGYTAEQRCCEQQRLQKWLNNPYDAQAQTGKSYERNRQSFATQFAALQRVINETSGSASVGQIDASAGIWGGAGSQVGLGGYPNSTDW